VADSLMLFLLQPGLWLDPLLITYAVQYSSCLPCFRNFTLANLKFFKARNNCCALRAGHWNCGFDCWRSWMVSAFDVRGGVCVSVDSCFQRFSYSRDIFCGSGCLMASLILGVVFRVTIVPPGAVIAIFSLRMVAYTAFYITTVIIVCKISYCGLQQLITLLDSSSL
jgi:hypothetical protein